MGLSCSCFSRLKTALEYSDESSVSSCQQPSHHVCQAGDTPTPEGLDTIVETSERASSGERKISDEARSACESVAAQEQRHEQERRSVERRQSSEAARNTARRSEERHTASQRSSEDSFSASQKEEDLRVIAEILNARKKHTPVQVERFMALLRASPGKTPNVRTGANPPAWPYAQRHTHGTSLTGDAKKT